MLILAVLASGLGLERVGAADTGAPVGIGSSLLARVHFVGTRQIAADTNADELKELGAMPETAALQEATLRKLAVAPYALFKGHTASTNVNAGSIRPLLEDLLHVESYVEVQDSTNAVPELMLAAHVGTARLGIWQTSLEEALTTWTGIKPVTIQAEGFEGWEIRKHHDPKLIRFFRAGDWVVFGFGQDELKLQTAWLQRMKERNRPVDAAKDYWLDAWVDWPGLARHQLAPDGLKLPVMRLAVQGRKEGTEKGYVRPQLTMRFAEPLGLQLEPWLVPTNNIKNPLISFSAVRGLTAWLNEQPLVKQINAAPLPGQLFLWATDQIPYPSTVAMPMRNGTNYLERIQSALVAYLNGKLAGKMFKPEAAWTNEQVVITGLPFFGPYLRAQREAQGDYLMGGLMPDVATRKPAPAELFSEIRTRTNLVYYHWELTGTALKKWRSYTSLYRVILKLNPVDVESPAGKWIEAAWSKLGNCGTVVTMTGPNELTLVRNSPVGFSALEMTFLAKWLDAPGFPWSSEPAEPPPLPTRGNIQPPAPRFFNPPMAPGSR